MLKILHLTGHMGGGVGTVVLGYLAAKACDPTQRHTLVALDYLNDHAANVLTQAGVRHYGAAHAQTELLHQEIAAADVVLLHWWNHPLISDLLIRGVLPKCRLALWSHISGTPAPNNFTPRLFSYPDEFVFTTPLSYFDTEYVGLSEQEKKKVCAIWSTAGVERLSNLRRCKHEGFNIGYIGNLDFTKIHPDFVDICRSIDIPNVRFTVVGPSNEKLKQQIDAAGMADRIRCTGFVTEEEKWEELSKFDVFGYPLARHHYATCDQTLQEAMAVGIVPVVLDNPMETYMVKHRHVGLVARSTAEYAELIKELREDAILRDSLSANAIVYAREEYSLTKMMQKWDAVFSHLMEKPKSEKSWFGDDRGASLQPYQVFLAALGRQAGLFEAHLHPTRVSRQDIEDQLRVLGNKHNWCSENKSTVHQFARFFPGDRMLSEWSRIMKDGPAKCSESEQRND